ncbi:NEL-type E3 ubiquitin ligase domain-containing protein [Pseudomonas sp. NBRC 111132]|uniref:NEL-type E3 ubiquitin ligase domain-containing protein n=1 Tax=Pseudomonas sp. NBRC 111132 TaxID=1661047 RepID=UPI0009E970D4|nr:NEL-type E3 ubiquitin ligase domain-containing protein [Pseudomonas sp. NBRC 111132]
MPASFFAPGIAMISSTSNLETSHQKATDDFIAARLPDWLKRASQAQIIALRTSLNTHQASQARLRGLTQTLQPLQVFAQQHLQGVLVKPLPVGMTLAGLEWLQVSPRIGTFPGTLQQTYHYSATRRDGLLRLMGNFGPDESFFLGTGLVLPGRDDLLTGTPEQLVAACRALDVGRLYQDELARTFNATTEGILAQDKRSGLALAAQVAMLKGDIDEQVQHALLQVVEGGGPHSDTGLHGYPGLLEVLGQRVADGLFIRLRDSVGQDRGVVLYLPSDPVQALRRFDSTEAMNAAMAATLQEKGYRDYFTQLISLRQRASFAGLLSARLSDPQPDLALRGPTAFGDLFAALAAQQVQRVKDDARLLLVPTADADAAAARARRAAWRAAGLDLLNLAGLFIPVVGAILLGQLVVQTLGEVFEGVRDWARGHQHEALEHMLGVAETVAATALTVAGVSVLRSAFVDGLQPVSVGGRRGLLGSDDITAYESTPGTIALRDDGLYGDESRRWMRRGQRYYEVQRSEPEAPYRLCHPSGEKAYGPAVLHNGERSWRLMQDQPQRWSDVAMMLDTLWPQHPSIDAQRAAQVLRVAGVDAEELRGVLVENRPAPVNLRETLRRFEAHARIEAFFTRLASYSLVTQDSALLAWCEARAGSTNSDVLLRQQAALWGPLLDHLSSSPAGDDALLTLIRRDFAGLPEAYAQSLAAQFSEGERFLAMSGGRVTLNLASKARALLRLARLNRALEGLYLPGSYCNETGELAFALLQKEVESSNGVSANALDLQLRESAPDGHLLKAVGPAGVPRMRRVVVRKDGRFHLYDGLGRALPFGAGDSANLYDMLAAALAPEHRTALGMAENDMGTQLRQRLLARLPATHQEVVELLQWPTQVQWFNPGRRLADGRVGYLLSGRGTGDSHSLPARVRERLRQLYPGLDEAQLDQEQALLMNRQQSAYERIVELEDDQDQLIRHLNRWVSAELSERRQRLRQRSADAILRAWRLQGDCIYDHAGMVTGQRLSLSGVQLSSLPELPAAIDFHRITSLRLQESAVDTVPVSFLCPFTALTELDMSFNQLRNIPLGIAYLPQLQRLRLAHNQIRLNAQAVGILQAMPGLLHLDLSYNRLEDLDLRFNHLSALTHLNLRHCRLGAWPSRIELCGLLVHCDLRDNQLPTPPEAVIAMPYAWRRGLIVDRNPLRGGQLQRLYALDPIEEHGHLPESMGKVDLPHARSLWLQHIAENDRAARAVLWDGLLAEPDSAGFFRILAWLEHTADYASAVAGGGREVLVRDVWAMLQAMDVSPALRLRVFEAANQPVSCSDMVSDRFSHMNVQVLLAKAEADAQDLTQRAQLMAFGRQLYRLDQVQQQARQAILRQGVEGEQVGRSAWSLAYRVRLRERLDLPGQPWAMRYPNAVALSDQHINDVAAAVLANETIEARTQSLVSQAFWETFLGEQHRNLFESLRTDYLQRRANLRAIQPPLSAEQLRSQVADLEDQEQCDRERLQAGLTESYLRGESRGDG